MTSEAWPFHPSLRANYDLPPTQIKEALKRLVARKVADIAADNEEILNVITQVHQAYSKKKERARQASSRARAKATAEEPLDIEVEVANEPSAGICEVVAEAEQAPEPEAAPEPAAAAPPKAAAPRAAKRVDNVAAPAHPAVEPPAPAPKRAAAEAPAPRRRGGGLVGMVASIALP